MIDGSKLGSHIVGQNRNFAQSGQNAAELDMGAGQLYTNGYSINIAFWENHLKPEEGPVLITIWLDKARVPI